MPEFNNCRRGLLPDRKDAKMNILDVGCGNNKIPGAVGIDMSPECKADIICDLESFPWPIEDNSFNLIYCRHILEHLTDVVKTVEEIYRISKPQAKIIIEVPHFSHPDAFRDPTHKHYFTHCTFDYFTDNPLYPKYTKVRFRILKREFKATSGINRFISKRINPYKYEERYARIFPSYGLYFELEAIK